MFSFQHTSCLVFTQPLNEEFGRHEEITVLYFNAHEHYHGFDYFVQKNIIENGRELLPQIKLQRLSDSAMLNILKTLAPEHLNEPIYEENKTPLMLCAHQIMKNSLCFLLEQGAQPNYQQNNNDAAIHYFFHSPYLKLQSRKTLLQILHAFIKHQTDFNLVGCVGGNAIQLFLDNLPNIVYGKQDIFEILLKQTSLNNFSVNHPFDLISELMLASSSTLSTPANLKKIIQAGYDFTAEKMRYFAFACAETSFDSYNSSLSDTQLNAKRELFEFIYEIYPFDLNISNDNGKNLIQIAISQKNLFLMQFLIKHQNFHLDMIMDNMVEINFKQGITYFFEHYLVSNEALLKHYDILSQSDDETLRILVNKQWLDIQLSSSAKNIKKMKL